MIKTEKQKNALLYAVESYPQIGRTKLMKFVFFVDLFVYNKRGEPLLEDRYKRLKNGPVPEFGFSFTETSNDVFTVTKEPCDPERIIYQYTPLQKADTSSFTRAEMLLFDTILRALKKHKTEEISNLTHRFRLWKNVKSNEIIPLEDLKLDEYEYSDFESFVCYTDAVADAERSEGLNDTAPNDRVPDEFIALQFTTMCGEQ